MDPLFLFQGTINGSDEKGSPVTVVVGIECLHLIDSGKIDDYPSTRVGAGASLAAKNTKGLRSNDIVSGSSNVSIFQQVAIVGDNLR